MLQRGWPNARGPWRIAPVSGYRLQWSAASKPTGAAKPAAADTTTGHACTVPRAEFFGALQSQHGGRLWARCLLEDN